MNQQKFARQYLRNAGARAAAQPSPDWRVNVDGDLCMDGQAIAAPAQMSPDHADYWTACANVKLAAAAPAMHRALRIAYAALALIDCSEAQRQSAKLEVKAALALAGLLPLEG